MRCTAHWSKTDSSLFARSELSILARYKRTSRRIRSRAREEDEKKRERHIGCSAEDEVEVIGDRRRPQEQE